jgi:hypothetical protein
LSDKQSKVIIKKMERLLTTRRRDGRTGCDQTEVSLKGQGKGRQRTVEGKREQSDKEDSRRERERGETRRRERDRRGTQRGGKQGQNKQNQSVVAIAFLASFLVLMFCRRGCRGINRL